MMKTKKKTKKNQSRQIKVLVLALVVVVLLIATALWMNKSTDSTDSIAFPYDNLPVLGDQQAPVKIVEVSDFKCPYCKVFNTTILPQIKTDFVDTGIASVYYLNQAFVGPDSMTASIAAQSVFRQQNEAFWTFKNALYEHQGSTKTEWATEEFLIGLAHDLQLPIDLELFEQDLKNKVYEQDIIDQINFANKHQITSTPSVFINGEKYTGEMTVEAIGEAIRAAATTK